MMNSSGVSAVLFFRILKLNCGGNGEIIVTEQTHKKIKLNKI